MPTSPSPRRSRPRWAILLLLAASCGPLDPDGSIGDPGEVDSDAADLFAEQQPLPPGGEEEPGLVGRRTATLHEPQLAALLAGRTVRYRAPGSAVVIAGASSLGDGRGRVVVDALGGGEEGSAQFIVQDGVLQSGLVVDPATGHSHVILRTEDPGVYLIEEQDPEATPPCADGPPGGGDTGEAAPPAPPPPTDGVAYAGAPVEVKLAFFWTSKVVAQLNGSTTATRAAIEQAVARANQVYANSQIRMRLKLVHAGPVSYTEASYYQMLSDLTVVGDNKLDEVHGIRDAVGADLVSLFVANDDLGGVAHINSTPTTAFTVVARQWATSQFVLAHEIGHNVGAVHDRGSASFPGVYPFSYGRGFTGLSGKRWRTVMAYKSTAGGTRIPYFSNPLVKYDGVATGVSELSPNGSDNARTHDLRALVVAAFRGGTPQVVDTVPPAVSLTSPVAGGTSSAPTLSATAADDVGITRVVFYVDGAVVGQDTSAPYSMAAPATLAVGPHTFSARAYDAAGNWRSSPVVTAEKIGGQLTAPRVAMPADGAIDVTEDMLGGVDVIRWWSVPGATRYDVYHGTSDPPALLGTIAGSANPSEAYPGARWYGVDHDPAVRYYWRIVAHGGTTTAASPVWTYQMAQ